MTVFMWSNFMWSENYSRLSNYKLLAHPIARFFPIGHVGL